MGEVLTSRREVYVYAVLERYSVYIYLFFFTSKYKLSSEVRNTSSLENKYFLERYFFSVFHKYLQKLHFYAERYVKNVDSCGQWTVNKRGMSRWHPFAERQGFEPWIRLPVCRISSAVHSTSLASLQFQSYKGSAK